MDESTNTSSQTHSEITPDSPSSNFSGEQTVNCLDKPRLDTNQLNTTPPKSLHKQLIISSDAARDYMERNSQDGNKPPPTLVLSVQPSNQQVKSPNQQVKIIPASENKSGKSNRPVYADNSPEYSDTMDESTDPYDTVNGEEKFCGGYNEWGYVVHHVERSILVDLKSYPFPDDIKNQADVIYNKMRYQVRRGKIRFQMLFFCTYNAHIELGRDVNPIQLGAIFGLTQGEVQRCDSLFSPLQTGYRPPSINTSPLGYLPDYCHNMNLSQECVDDIMRMSSAILRKDVTLFQENPQTVAAGLLRYYTITNGITTDDPQKITRVTNRSTVTIDGMFRRIATIDNS
jgi:hypothetical protein